jgi:hypothetical protein
MDRMRELLTQSLVAWRLTGDVGAADDGAILVCCGQHRIRVEPASADVPFRWMVTIGDRRRGAISLVAVLRQIRATLEPGYASVRAQVTAFPLALP